MTLRYDPNEERFVPAPPLGLPPMPFERATDWAGQIYTPDLDLVFPPKLDGTLRATEEVTVYLCGPMAHCTEEEMRGWRDTLKQKHPEITWRDPCDRNYKPQQWRQLVEDDIADIDASDFVLAHYWKTGTGSAMELSYCHRVAKIPSIVVVPDFKKVSPWLRYHADYLVEDFDTAMKIIKAEGFEG